MVARVTRLVAEKFVLSTFPRALTTLSSMCSRAVRALESSPGLVMMMDRSEASPAARNTLDSARIPRASKLLICGLFQKGRVLAQDGDTLAAADFFTTEIWTPAGLVTFYVLFAIQLKTRRVHISIRYCQVDVERANLSRRADFLCSHRTAQVTSCQTMKARSRSSR